MAEYIYGGLTLGQTVPDFLFPDPTDPQPIDPFTPTTTGTYRCNPPQSAPSSTPVFNNNNFLIQSTTFICILEMRSFRFANDGEVEFLTVPVSSIKYVAKGCYVVTPDTLTVVIPASEDISSRLESRLDGGKFKIIRVIRTQDGIFYDEWAEANFDSWTMIKNTGVFEYVLQGTRTIEYSNPMHRAVGSLIQESGDFSDYTVDKILRLAGYEALYIKPGDYVEYNGTGLYVDRMVGAVGNNRFDVELMQFGRET